MLDNPTIGDRTEATRIQSQSNLNTPIGVNRAIPLVVDPKGTSVTPIGAHKDERIGGPTDLMALPIAIKGFGEDSVVNVWTTTQLPGTTLFAVPVGPLFEVWNQHNVLHPLSSYGSLYDLWTGDLIYEVDFYHTQFNKGSVAAAFWNYQTGQGVTVDITKMTHSNLAQVNLAGNYTRLSVRIPFKHQLTRLKTYDGSRFDECFTGSLVIYNVTTLQTKDGFPAEVPFVVRVSSDNLRFSNHSINQSIVYGDWPPATSKMDFVRDNYSSPVSEKGQHSLNIVRKEHIRRQGEEGTVEVTKDVYHEAGYGKAVEDVIKPLNRLRVTPYTPEHSSKNVAQREWDIRKIFSQAHVIDFVDFVLPTPAGAISYYPLPNSAFIEENLSPCVKQNFRFYTYDLIKTSLVINTMNGIAGAGFMVYLRGITNQADADALLAKGLQQIIDMNGGVIFSLATHDEIHLDCRNVYPLNNFSQDTPDNCGTLVVGLYTDTILGAGQTGTINFTLKASVQGFEIKEPNYNPSVSSITRQGDQDQSRESSDQHQTSQVDNTQATKAEVIHINPYQERVPPLDKIENDHTDSVMSFEQLKRYERVINIDIASWKSTVFDFWELLQRHKLLFLTLRMVRFVHFGIRVKVRVIPETNDVNRSLTAGFRGMYGADNISGDMSYQEMTLGNLTPDDNGGSSRAAFAEMNSNTVGEQLDFEVPYTSVTKLITINGTSNKSKHLGYDFGSIFIATNKEIPTGTLAIYIALSDDCTFSCP
jgi:hypothetical protein